MKKIYLFLCFCLTITHIQAQEIFKINPKKIVDSFVSTINYKKAYNGNVNRQLLDSTKLVVNLPEEGEFEYIAFLNSDKKWIGKNVDNTSNLIIIKGDSSIIGSITTLYSSYQIFSTNNNEVLFVEIADDLLGENICGTEDSYVDQYREEPNYNTKTAITNEPLKILIAYTPGSESQVASETGADIKDYALLLIEMANMSYKNSGIGHRLELATCVKVDYAESGSIFTDRDRFRNATDGYMDEIHELRNIYSADVCVLFVDWRSHGGDGVAVTIGATAETAFCVVKTKLYATNTYIFAHEIGHLQGARHEYLRDSSISPSKYAHGYISPNNNWRTIMAYEEYCNGCKCVQYWSNPYVIYPEDGLAMGSTEYENNALVLNENTERMKSFRTPPATITLFQSGVKNITYGEMKSINKISTSGTVVVQSSSELILEAPNIELNAGFSIDLGAEIIIGP